LLDLLIPKPPAFLRDRLSRVKRLSPLLPALCLTVTMGGCATPQEEQRKPSWNTALQRAWITSPGDDTPAATSNALNALPERSAPAHLDNDIYQPGSGNFIAPTPVADARVQKDGDIKLNFQDANLLEVVQVILGDMLGMNYTVHPAVQGSVSMQTTDALHRDDLVPTLELLLRMNNAALITDNGIYRVMPMSMAITGVRAPQLGDATLSLPPGYSVRIVPLRYVAAEEMAQILSPFVTDSSQLVRVDSQRNLLILAANGGDMDRLLETIHVFDVDRMQGMSVAMFTPDFVEAKVLAEQLDKLLADPEAGLMAGMVRFMVVENLNGLMVITPSAQYLEQVRDWIHRLDRDNGATGRHLFIYRVQNGKAVELAETLNRLFQPGPGDRLPDAEIAPGLRKTSVGDLADEKPSETAELAAPVPVAVPKRTEPGLLIPENANVRIIADEPNNALLILAAGSEYRQILSALKQLDVSPMQVLVEVTIAEVTLTDDLKYGVEWYFNNQVGGSMTGFGMLDLGAAGIGALTPGFSYALKGTDGTVNAVINMLANESNLSIVSSPSLLVLNNQEASIQVGDEVPLVTLQRISEESTTTLNTVEYRDTGVLLTVKPRINSGGLVIMEIDQETSAAKPTATPDESPVIQTRKISSTVAINSGDTIILGGLIEDNYDRIEQGVPGLHKVPMLGNLFGATTDNQERTELLVLINPKAITHRTSALQATEDFRRKLHSLIPANPLHKAPANVPDF